MSDFTNIKTQYTTGTLKAVSGGLWGPTLSPFILNIKYFKHTKYLF